MCQGKKEEEDLIAFKIASIHRYNDLKTTPKKARKEPDYSHQKQYRKHKDQQNRNNQKKMGRKTTVWKFHATNKRNIIRENMDMAKKGKP